jgi:xylulokinase
VAFGLRDGLDLMVTAGVPHPDSVRASGGGIKSEVWRQILADVLDTRVDIANTDEGAAFGAATLAAVGGGWHRDVSVATDSWVAAEPAAEPSSDAATYALLHQGYAGLYPALRETFHVLAD